MNFPKLASNITLTAVFALGGLAPQLLAAGDTPALPDGVTKEDWSTIRESIIAQRHAFRSTAAGFEATSPRFDWDAEFDGDSALIQPPTRDWSFGLALHSYGFPGDLQQLSTPAFGSCAEGQRMTYSWTQELSEWWVNDQRGFEHGFTVHERPLCRTVDTGGPLTFELEVLGTLMPKVNAAQTGLSLSDQEGGVVLRYDGLVALDANGVALEAWLEVDGDALRICVDESSATYPILVDPVVQEAYLKASNTQGFDAFGRSVAAFGDTIVVGAINEDSPSVGVDGNQGSNTASSSGAAYVFVRSGSSWSQQAYLKASNTGGSDQFGSSAAISGDTIVVAALGEGSSSVGVDGDQSDNSAQESGAAYVFVRSGTSWSQEAYLKASNTGVFDRFGSSVAVSGDTIVVGADREDSSATGVNGDGSNDANPRSGAAYVLTGIGGIGRSYCVAAVNSTGAAGRLEGSGSASIAENSLTLVATSLPSTVFGFFITSTSQDFVANPGGSEGNLCLGGSIGRYVGPGQMQQADASGAFSLQVDLANTPQPSGTVSISAGETWSFQAWYRDSGSMGSTSNFTNGLEVVFTM